MDNEFCDRLRVARAMKGIKQFELAELVRVDRAVVSHWERGHREPNLPTIRRLCRALAVSADYLLGLSESPLP